MHPIRSRAGGGPWHGRDTQGRLKREQAGPAAGEGYLWRGTDGGERHQRLARVQPGDLERGDVPVAAVLTQHVDGVPQDQVQLARPGQVRIGDGQRASGGAAARRSNSATGSARRISGRLPQRILPARTRTPHGLAPAGATCDASARAPLLSLRCLPAQAPRGRSVPPVGVRRGPGGSGLRPASHGRFHLVPCHGQVRARNLEGLEAGLAHQRLQPAGDGPVRVR